MKKTIALLMVVLVLVCFVGCGTGSDSPVGSDVSVISLPLPDSSSAYDNSSIADGKFTFSSQEVFDALDAKVGDSKDFAFFIINSFEEENYYIDWTATRYGMQSLCYSQTDGDDIEAVSLSLRNGKPSDATSARFIGLFEEVFALCGGTDVKAAKGELKLSSFTKGETTQTVSNGLVVTFHWDDERMDFTFAPEAAEIDSQQLPLNIVKPEGILQNTELLEEIRVLNSKYDYAGIVGLIESNVAVEQLAEADPVRTLYELAVQGQEIVKNCVVKVDEFDGKVKVYYRGVEQISSSINYVPYLDGNQARNIFGFKASEWLFFDALEIKVGETDKITQSFSYFDVNRNTLSGGIEEWIDLSMSEREAGQILEYEAPAIRFRNKDEDRNRDHTMTIEEIDALRTINELQPLNVAVINQVVFWKEL